MRSLMPVLLGIALAAVTVGASYAQPQSGHGSHAYPSGRYEGEFLDGRPHGRGVLVFTSGGRYEGEFHNGLKHGRGAFTWASGSRYDGDWVNDKATGDGVYVWPNGDRYEGEWLEFRAHGRGIKRTASGQVYRGIWQNGCFREGDLATTAGATREQCGF